MRSEPTGEHLRKLKTIAFSYHSSKFCNRTKRPKSALSQQDLLLLESKTCKSLLKPGKICGYCHLIHLFKLTSKVNTSKRRMDYKEFASNQSSYSDKQSPEVKQTGLPYLEYGFAAINDSAFETNAKKGIPHPSIGRYMFLPDINVRNSMIKKIATSQNKETIGSILTSNFLRSHPTVIGLRNSDDVVRSLHVPEDSTRKTHAASLIQSEIDQPMRIKLDKDLETKRFADRAIKEGKIFICNGPYQGLRVSLRKRGWVEKFQSSKDNSISIPRSALVDDEGDKISSARAEDGVRLAFMSSIVQCHSPTLMFTVKTSEVVNRAMKDTRIVNHFGRATAFTTKIGLSYSLRSSEFFSDESCDAFFPRCYNLSCEEDKQAFIEDYNLTSCMAILKFFVTQHENSSSDKFFYGHVYDIFHKSETLVRATESETRELLSLPLLLDSAKTHRLSPNISEGITSIPIESGRIQKHVSTKAIRFALDRCLEFVACCKNEDIMEEFDEMKKRWMSSKEKHWMDFQDAYRLYVTNKLKVDKKAKEHLSECKNVLLLMEKHWPQFAMDGIYNVWILKPGAKSRGRGIKCSSNLQDIINNYASSSCVTVAQKYIEKPLLIYKTKFDLRQWFLVTDWNPLTLWFYKESYLRFCSKEFTLRDLHESIHLSNNSVQKNYEPSNNRPTQLPQDNMWTSDEFKEYLRAVNQPHAWSSTIVPGMKKTILNVLLCTQDSVDHRKESFELFGADFMLTEDYHPWLIEINSSPSMARNTKATAYLVNKVLEDTIKVIIDRRSNPTCETGQFELVHQQKKPSEHPSTTGCSSIMPHFVIGNKVAHVARE